MQNRNYILLLQCQKRQRPIGLWCNGNTTDSGPVIPGSNPGSPTKRPLEKGVFFYVYSDRYIQFIGLIGQNIPEISYLAGELNHKSMKSKLLILFVALCAVSCSSVLSTKSVKDGFVHFLSLDVEDFAKYIAQENVMLVDVRTPEEFEAGHIKGVDSNLDVRSATFFKDYQSLPKDRPIALYCKGGGRSKQVAGVLAGNGYTVVELKVGYDGWVEAGGIVER